MTELLNLRTRTSKTFDLGNGQRRAEVCSGPVHYKRTDVPSWTPISLLFAEDLTGIPKFLATEQAMTIGTRLDGERNKFVGARWDHAHQFEQTPVSVILSGVERLTGNFLSVTQIADNQVAHNIAAGIDYIHDLRWTGVRGYVKVLNAPTSFLIRYRFDLTGFECCNLIDANGGFIPDANNTFHFADVLTGEYAFCLRQPVMWDELKMSAGISHRLYMSGGFLYYEKASTLEGEAWLATAAGAVSIDATIDVNSSTGDGELDYDEAGTADWATVWGGATAAHVYASATTATAEASYDGLYYCSRYHGFFDTSAIGSGSTINTATLTLTVSSSSGSPVLSAQESTSADPIVAGSYNDFTGLTFGQTSAGGGSISFNGTGLAAINKTGTTKICVREYDKDYSNLAPASAIFTIFYTSNHATPGNRPKLTVDYTPPASTGIKGSLALLGVGF